MPLLKQGANLPEKGKSPTDINGGKGGSNSIGPNLPQTLCNTFMEFGPGGMALPLRSQTQGWK